MSLLENLSSIGFTEYEAKVYLALLKESPATGYQVSKVAGIPRSMVYEALGRLHARGAVLRTEDHRSTLYRPVPPDVLLDRYEQEHLDLLKNLREDLHKLYNTQDEDRLWSISGRNSILSYAAQMIQAAETEVMLVLTDPDLAALRAEIEQVCGNGIKVHALLTGNDSLECGQVSGQVAHHPPLESELQELNRMLLVSVDGKEVLIASTNPDLSTNGTATATITSNRNLVLIARQFVWMELFTQRIYQQVGPDLLARLEPRDRQILAFWSVA